MKDIKFLIIILSILMLISACSMPDTAPVEYTESTATLVVNPIFTTEPSTGLSPASTTEMTAAVTMTATPILTSSTTVPSSGTGACVNSAEFISDVSIPDGTVFAPETAFVKTWRVKNTGTCTWDHRYSLVFADGTLLTPYDHLALPFVTAPGQTLDLSLDMTAPIYPGAYESHWKFQAPNGSRFGVGKKDSPLWLKLIIASPDTTTISGFVYQDLNGNSKYDFDDQLMANREVWLQQENCALNGPRLASAKSGNDGRYTITGSFSGDHCLSMQRPDETVYTLNISVTPGQHFDGADMQDAIPNLVISGAVWNDSLQPDGTQQASEPNLPGVTVLLQLGPCASPISLVPVSSTVDSLGRFSFGSLYGGTYCVSIRAGEGSNVSILGSGAWTTPANGSQQLTIRPGEQKSVSFGWQYK
ncbi:MAG: hypothetical protein L6Q49_09390 [Anaerolineales bacterium]|nr:hypothetical protein [Anaerolineales bacterium]